MSVRDLLDLRGKVALVTGGSRGIGLQMAEALGEMGARVAITARKQDELDEARVASDGAWHRMPHGGRRSRAVRDDSGHGRAVLRIWGPMDILVNNAGTNWAAPAEDYPDDGWRKVMDLNIDAQFFLSREVGRRSMIPRQERQDHQHRVDRGLFGNPPDWEMQTIAYNTSKGALVEMTRALAAEWGKYNINVNAICPGFFPSKMTGSSSIASIARSST